MTSHNFDMKSARQLVGGTANHLAHAPDNTRRNSSNLLPLSVGPILKRSVVAQALIDVACVGSAVLLVCAGAVSVPVSIFILLFVRV